MIFVKNGYTEEELQEIKNDHEDFVMKAKELVDAYEKLRSNLPAGDYDYHAKLPFSESLITPYESVNSLLKALSEDELVIVPLKTFEKKYAKGDEGVFDLFYDKEIIQRRNALGAE